MSTKIVCDGCGADTTPPFKPPFSSPGQLGDGLARQLELRLGNNMVKMDLCIACHKRARSWLVEAFPEMARTRADWWPAMALNEASELYCNPRQEKNRNESIPPLGERDVPDRKGR